MNRCKWCLGSENLMSYHDQDYGKLKQGTNELFKWLSLEGMQAGLSWQTIINLEKEYDSYFDNFVIEKVRHFNVEKLLENLSEAKIIRNKLKVKSVVSNAQVIYEIEKEMVFFDYLISLFEVDKNLEDNLQLIIKKMKKKRF